MGDHGSQVRILGWVIALGVGLLGVGLGSGCVERRLHLRTDPEGAEVYVNGRYAGKTPLDHPFVHYGTYQLDLWHHGYESLSTMVEVDAPWWQLPPFDLFADLDPRGLVDEHEFELSLEPVERGPEPTAHTDLVPPIEAAKERGRELLERAEELRGGGR